MKGREEAWIKPLSLSDSPSLSRTEDMSKCLDVLEALKGWILVAESWKVGVLTCLYNPLPLLVILHSWYALSPKMQSTTLVTDPDSRLSCHITPHTQLFIAYKRIKPLWSEQISPMCYLFEIRSFKSRKPQLL